MIKVLSLGDLTVRLLGSVTCRSELGQFMAGNGSYRCTADVETESRYYSFGSARARCGRQKAMSAMFGEAAAQVTTGRLRP